MAGVAELAEGTEGTEMAEVTEVTEVAELAELAELAEVAPTVGIFSLTGFLGTLVLKQIYFVQAQWGHRSSFSSSKKSFFGDAGVSRPGWSRRIRITSNLILMQKDSPS